MKKSKYRAGDVCPEAGGIRYSGIRTRSILEEPKSLGRAILSICLAPVAALVEIAPTGQTAVQGAP